MSPGLRRQTIAALRACLREDPAESALGLRELAAAGDLERLVKRAAFHNVVGQLRTALAPADGLAPATRAFFESERRLALAGHMRTVADLAGLSDILTAAGIPWVTFKGPMLTELVYSRADLRRYSDLDVLVAPTAFARAIEALQSAGLQLADRNWDAIRDEVRGQLHVVLPQGTVADVHWDLTINARVRGGFRIDVDPLLARAVPARLGPARAPVLEPTDALLHLCLHAGLDGGHRLIWLKDIERTVAVRPGDWEELVRRATDWRARLLVAAVLRRAREIAGADVPRAVLTALAPGGALAMCQALDRLLPPEAATGYYSLCAVWTRSTRDDVRSSAAALARTIRSTGLLSPQARRALRREAEGAFADGELSPYHPSGDEQAKAGFLGEVARDDGQ